MGNRKQQRWLEQGKQKAAEVAVEQRWLVKGNRKQQRWLEHGTQKAAEVAGAVEKESSRGGWSRGNRKQQRWL